MSGALGGAADLFADEDFDPYLTREGSALDHAFEAIRSLGTTLADSLISNALYSDIEDALGDMRTKMLSEITSLTAINFSGLSADEKTSLNAVMTEAVNAIGMDTLFNARSTFEVILTGLEDAAMSITGKNIDYISTAQIEGYSEQLRDAFIDTVAAEAVGGALVIDTEITLKNLAVGGEDILKFTQAGGAVTVDVAFGQLFADVDAIFEMLGMSGDTFAEWQDYIGSVDDAAISFTIAANTTGSGSGPYQTSVTFSGFTTNFTFGGALDTALVEDLDFTAGLLGGKVTAIELAEFGLDLSGTALTLSFNTSDFLVSANTGGGDVLGLTIKEAGSTDPAVAFDPQSDDYRFAVIEFETSMDWALSLIDVEADTLKVEGSIALVGSMDALTTDSSVQLTAYAGSDPVVDVDVVATLEDAANTVRGLMEMDGQAFISALASAASALDIVFSSDLFDIDIPFLDDFDLGSAAAVYQTISDLLLKPMGADISILGLSNGNNASQNGSLVIDGIVSDKTDGSIFKGEDTLSFTVTINTTKTESDGSGGTTTVPVSADHVVSLDVPDGGFASMKAFGDALKQALGAISVSADFGADMTLGKLFTVSVVRGEVELRASTLEEFSLSGAPGAMELLGITGRNDTASLVSPLAGLPIADLIESGWMALFQLNLDIERTITYDDGSEEVVTYRTLTLSPPDGGWTVDNLVDQLNDLFEAAGITMEASIAGDGLVFTVDGSSYDLDDVDNVAFSLSIDAAKASVASSIEALQAFVNEVFGGVHPLLPNVGLVLDFQSGEIGLSFSEINFGFATAFEVDIDAGLGELARLALAADMQLEALFTLGFDIGVSLLDLITSSAEEALSDFIWLDNVKFSAALSALAENISGSGRLGIVEVVVGDDDSKVEVGARLDVGLLGYDADAAEYVSRLTFTEIMDKANSREGIARMLGTFSLTGTATGDAFVHVSLGDIRVAIAGTSIGIGENAIEKFEASLLDVFAATDWVFDIDSAVVDLIMGLGTNDFIDTLYNSLILVDQLLNGLADELGFLGVEIPVLGISVLDAMDFAKDLAAQLQAFKGNPNEGLAGISASLSSAFGLGPDDLKLVWDGTDSVFYVALGMSFLDGPLTYDFSLDLARLLGDLVGSDSAVANLLSVASTISNVTGDGRIVLDAALGFNLTFGIDLSSVFGADTEAVTTATALAALAGVSQVTYNTSASGHQGRDVLISVMRTGNGAPEYTDIKIELDEAETVGDALRTIHAALAGKGVEIVIEGKDGDGNPVSLTLDGSNWDDLDDIEIGNVAFADTVVEPTDYTDLDALFGVDAATAASGTPPTLSGAVDLADIDHEASYSFALVINGADPVQITIPADSGRDAEGFLAALNEALAETSISRAAIGLGLPMNLKIGTLITAEEAGGRIALVATNFTEAIDADQIAFSVTGIATGKSATVTVTDLGGSNIARALGFAAQDGSALKVVGDALEARAENTGVKAFIVTRDTVVGGQTLEGTGVYFEFLAGVPDGLNMSLSLGPLSAGVVNGMAVIGDGDGGRAFVRFGIDDAADAYLDPDANDADDYANDGRVYFDAVIDVFAGSDEIDVSDLFTFDAKAALELVLPLQDSLGLLEMAGGAGISIMGDLFSAEGSFSGATGALVALFNGGSVSDHLDVDINLPDFADILGNINPWAIINDPILLTNGLEMILTSIDKTLRSVIKAMNLPIVGDAMIQGLTVFNDIAHAILQPIQEAANTPNPDGSMPTTIDLIERVVNDALKGLFGITDPNFQIIRAVLTEDMDNPSIVAEIYLEDFVIFAAALDVGFDLGIPGLNLSVGQSSELLFEIAADLNIAFGIDKGGFFFLNDIDQAEIVLSALVKTSGGFTASASLGLVGLALTANEIDDHDFGGSIRGAVIGGRIEIDLFTTLGRAIDHGAFDDEVADYGRGNGYENIVRLGELSSGKSSSGEGTRLVSLTGEFVVHVDMHMTTSVINPVTGDAITELPSAVADFVFDARYEIGGELEMIRLEFQDVGLYAGDFLVNNVLPIVDEIYGYVKPIADMVKFLKDPLIAGISIYDVIEPFARAYSPAALFVFDAIDTLEEIIYFIEGLRESGGTIYFGTFSLLSPSSATGVVDTSSSKAVGNLRPTGEGTTGSQGFSLSGSISNTTPGISFLFPIFTDPSNVLNLITGNLAEVELFEVSLTLLDFTLNVDFIETIKSAVSFLPGKVLDVLFGGMKANFYLHAEAGITVGYDLYGIAQFLGSGQVIDILDGMYFDPERPLLQLEASLNVGIGINLAVIKAGLNLSAYFGVEVSMNDPNNDGKLRFGEIVWVATEHSVLDLFEGEIKLGFALSVYFKLDLFLFSIGGSWTVIDFNFAESFGKNFSDNPHFLDTDSSGVTTLNVGATAGKQVGGSAVDGNDDIHFDGDKVYINGKYAGTVGSTVLIYAGEGDNRIDLSGLSASINFQVFTGDGDDLIIVGGASGIISAGGGNDRILSAEAAQAMGLMMAGFIVPPPLLPYGPATGSSTPAPMPSSTAPTSYGAVKDRVPTTSNQTLLVLARGGAHIDMHDSTASMVVVATALDIEHEGNRVELSDWVQANYLGEPITVAATAEILAKIKAAMPTYTAIGQTRADSGDSFIHTGTGNDIIFAGNGNDTIVTEGGNNVVFAGAGDDHVTLKGSGNNWVEGGAGADVILGGSGSDVLMGWGRFDATTTMLEFTGALTHLMNPLQIADFAELVRTSVLDDDSDWIEGGGGNDILVGNGGMRNVIVGGTGDDVLVAGTGHDILAGGSIALTLSNGDGFSQTAGFNPIGTFTITAHDTGHDGNDSLYGGSGNNVLIGGGGNDRLEGGGGSNVVIGDFAEIKMSGSSKVLSVESTHIHSAAQGDDIMIGGALADVMVGGGGQDLMSGGNGRNIIIGDNAKLISTNLFEGVTELVSLLGAQDDADVIYSGVNTSVIVAGGSRQAYGDYISTGHLYGVGADTAVQGMIIFADYGDLTGALLAPKVLTTVFDAGNDDVIDMRGNGNDIIFGGAGNDSVSSGGGDDIIFGDTGTYRAEKNGLVDAILSTDHNALDNPQTGQTGDSVTLIGNDTLAAGDGNNIVFGGGGDDLIATGEGDDLVFGDNGLAHIALTASGNLRLYAEGRNTEHGGDDAIYTNGGDDVIIGGNGNDAIDAGADNDIAAGDWAMIDFVAQSLTTQAPDHGGTDLIAGGDGDDIVIGGWGDDRLSGGGDSNVVIGDYASLTWTGRFALKTLVLDAIHIVGHDLIFTNYDAFFGSGVNAEGNSIGIGGAGNDEIHGGAANDMLFADWGTFLFLDPDLNPGMSAFDRIMEVESTQNGVYGHDRLYGHDGRDIVIAGNGNDYVEGGNGQDLISGDAAIYVNYHDGWELLESRFPFVGGDDVLKGDAGNNIIIAGFFNFPTPGAGDLLYGDTIKDFLMGDAGSILIFNGKVIRFNYLGIEPKDLISTNQLGASAGVLMRPFDYYPDTLGSSELGWTPLAPSHADSFVFDPDADVSGDGNPALHHLDAVFRAVMLTDNMLHLIGMYRDGAISAGDLEEAIRQAVLAALADRYGYDLPDVVLFMLSRYIELLMAEIAEDSGAEDAASAGAGAGEHGTQQEAGA